jgi:hypothetical protein
MDNCNEVHMHPIYKKSPQPILFSFFFSLTNLWKKERKKEAKKRREHKPERRRRSSREADKTMSIILFIKSYQLH